MPALALDDGSKLYDSRVICEYLDAQSGGKNDVTFPLIVVDTLIYGSLVFVLLVIPEVLLLAIVMRSRNPQRRESE